MRGDGSVTAGNASGINDGAWALLIARDEAAQAHGLTRLARIVGMATAGVAPRTMGMGPVPAVQKLLRLTGLPGFEQITRLDIRRQCLFSLQAQA